MPTTACLLPIPTATQASDPSWPHKHAVANGHDEVLIRRSEASLSFVITTHARSRMHQRSISEHAVATVLTYGRCLHARGATVYAIGHKEVAKFAHFGIDLKDFAGYQVVCSPDDVILTVYRNHDFRTIRKTRGRRSGYNRHAARPIQSAHA